jgi:transcriptional regulator with XRE-family HTH domain
MADDHGPVVQSAVLRVELVRLRRRSQLSQYEIAHELGWQPSTLIRIEGGRSPITQAELDSLLDEYGVDSVAERERLHSLNQRSKNTGWWDDFRSKVPGPYLNYIGYEAGTAFIRQFPGTVIPGLLQTAEYAEALTARAVDPVLVGTVVEVRLKRREELMRRSSPPRQYYVLDESVIRRHVGVERDPGIMLNQLQHIADMAAEGKSITVRVIPFNAGVHAGLSGPFTLLEFDGGISDLLYLDTGRAELATLTGDDPAVAEYADKFESLLDFALPEARSIELIRSAAEEMS